MEQFSKKKILLIAPSFFGYEKEIETELIRLGAQVDLLPDRPFSSSLAKAATRLCRQWLIPYMDAFFMSSIKKLGTKRYDAIFVIQGEGLSIGMLTHFKEMFPEAQLILYMWDSMRNKKSLLANLELYDVRFTFDKTDSRTLDMRFRPLFFAPGFAKDPAASHKYDLSFIGTAHSDRYRIVSNISQNNSNTIRFFKYIFLQAPWLFYIKKIFLASFRSASITDFNFIALSGFEVQKIFHQSLAIVDIEHPRQTGLTMRTFETLGSRKKLITTNSAIQEYDFYDPQNIFVFDRKGDGKIPVDFFTSPYRPINSDIFQKYSLNEWLVEIFSTCPWWHDEQGIRTKNAMQESQ